MRSLTAEFVDHRPYSRARRRVAIALLALALAAAPASAADLEWAVISGWSTGGAVAQAAARGFRVQAVVAAAPEPLVLMMRPCCGGRSAGAVAEYLLVSRREVDGNRDPLAALTKQRLVSFAADRLGGALAVFEADPRGGERYRSLVGDAAGGLEAEVDRLAGEGFRCVGGAGRTVSALDWLLFAEAPDEAGNREARLVVASGAEPFVAAVNTLASEGFELDCAFSRGTGRFSLLPARHLAAVVSRPRGSTRPVAHIAVDLRSPPSGGRDVVAMVAYGSDVAFVSRPGDGSAWVRHVPWPDAASAVRQQLEEDMRSHLWNPIDRAWVEWSAGVPSQLGVTDLEEPSATVSRTVAAAPEPLAVPPGASALSPEGDAPWAAYRALLTAIASRDLKGAKALWTGEVATGWAERVEMFKAPFGLGFSEKSLFADLHEEQPTDPRFIAGWSDGAAATLRVEGTVSGRRSLADVGLVREGEPWLVATIGPWRPLADD